MNFGQRVLSATTLLRCCVFGALFLILAPAASDASIDGYADYDYGLELRSGQSFEVNLDVGGFSWPKEIAAQLLQGADTALLEVDLRSKGFQSHIEARCAKYSSLHYFDIRSRGRRYLDLSSLLEQSADCSRVELTGHRAKWLSGPARLTLFDNPDLEAERVLVIASHPDDAEIAAFGLFSTTDSDIVTILSGDAGSFRYRNVYPKTSTHYRIKGLLRTIDSVTVPLIAGVAPGRARNLGYYGNTLKDLYEYRPEPIGPRAAKLDDPAYFRKANLDQALREQSFEPTWPGLIAALEGELDRVKPSVIVAPNPFLDSHRDHQYSTLALLEALENWPQQSYELYLYTNHAVDAESYPFGPRDSTVSLPPWRDPGLIFDRVYSHPLAKETQLLKIMALEAMHDLRVFSLREAPTLRQQTRRWWRTFRSKFTGRSIDNSYFRRAPRPNEIFLVLKPLQGQVLRSAFLDLLASD